MRCLTLADALRRSDDANISFVSRQNPGHCCDQIEERGYRVSRLPALATQTRGGWQEDAVQTRLALESSGSRPAWLVVDHYAIGQEWERSCREVADHILVIDDLADRAHDCDVLLDQNLVAGLRDRYRGLVPDGCALLLGPRYAMLQAGYAQVRSVMQPRTGPIRRLLISFGGADVDNLTGRALAGVLALNRPELRIDVVISDSSPHAGAIRRLAASHPQVAVQGWLPTLAPLMAESDLMIGAGGATSWERLCLGLPSLVVIMAENQRPIAEELQRLGLVDLLGDSAGVSESTFGSAVMAALDKGRNEEAIAARKAQVDGNGARRVAAALTVNAATPLIARHAEAADAALLLDWANDPATRRNSFNTELISWETHCRWFSARLYDSAACSFYIIATTDGAEVGQVRFEKEPRAWEIHYSMAPVFRGRGLGQSLLEAAIQRLCSERDVPLIRGRVRCDNVPSRRLFERLGFAALPGTGADLIEYERPFELRAARGKPS